MDHLLLTQVGFLKDKTPFFRYRQNSSSFVKGIDFQTKLSLEFKTNSRHCIGWYDVIKGENYVCPKDALIDSKYEQCPDCQAMTGFNPAFYNSSDVSEVQLQYNALPHFCYLAYFSDQDIKVGISQSGRDLSRLLEQGARAAIKLETFPSANIARQYEANISKLGFAENVKLNKKLSLLSQKFNLDSAKASLESAKQKIETELQTKFDKAELINLNQYFFAPGFDYNQINDVINMTEQAKISGQIVAVIGSIIICQYKEFFVALPLKKFTGYNFEISNEISELELPVTQFSLF